MFLENVLIPAVLLVNGVTILQAQAMDEVSYFHIELDSHDVLLAEGAPSESFIDNGITLAEIIADQPRTDVGGPYGFSITIPGGFSPDERHVLDIQPVGSQTRLGHTPWILDLQQEAPTPSAEALPPRGWIDIASRDRISGWICTPDDLATPVARSS